MNRTVEIIASGSSLRFDTSNDAEGHSTFAVTARCKGATVTDSSLYFDKHDRERFLSEFAAFEQTRRGSATLASTPEFEMQIAPDGAAGDAWVSFRLHLHIYSDLGRAGSRSGTLTIESGLPLSGEFIAQKLQEFHAYFDVHANA